MAVADEVPSQRKLTLGIPDHKVGVVARSQRPLAAMQSGQARRAGAHPADKIGDLMASAARLGPDGAQAELQAGDSAPCMTKVAVFD